MAVKKVFRISMVTTAILVMVFSRVTNSISFGIAMLKGLGVLMILEAIGESVHQWLKRKK
jgi:uncharacterized membrane protein